VTTAEFAACVVLLRRLWPHATDHLTADVLETWEGVLLDLEATHVAAAIHAFAVDGDRWPPPVGAIRKRALSLTAPVPEGDEAWGEVRRQIAVVGSKRGMLDFGTGRVVEPVWSHPLIGEVADRFGWQELCMSENQMADRAHFLRMWGEASARRRTFDALTPAARAVLEAAGVRLPDLRTPELLS